MKVVVESARLLAAVKSASRLVPRKSTHPYAVCLLLEAEADTLAITATNFNQQVTHRCPARIKRSGRACVAARSLHEWLDALDGEAERTLLATNPSGTLLHVVQGRFRAWQRTLGPDEFPIFGDSDFDEEFGVSGAQLGQALKATTFAALSKSDGAVLGNVLLETSSGGLAVGAADGFRVAHSGGRSVGPPATRLLPREAAEELETLLGHEGQALLTSSSTQSFLKVEAGSFELITRLGSGQFPDYQGMLDMKAATRASVDRSALRQGVGLATAIGARIELRFAGDHLELLAERREQEGESTTCVPIDAVITGPAARVSVNGMHLRDALDAIRSEQVEVYAGSSLVLRGVGDDATYALVVHASVALEKAAA